MGKLERNHYVQKRLLDNFATLKNNGKYKISILDLWNFKVYYRNTDRAFYSKNLYDVNNVEDTKILECKFKEKIEDPMCAIVDMLVKHKGEIILKRNEIETIKKYILLQYYRSVRNREGYVNPPKETIELCNYNIKEGESKEDFWKREMLTILDNDWDTLTNSISMIGVKKYVTEIDQNFLMFFSTDDEFCINDLGYVTERIPIIIPDLLKEEYVNKAKHFGKEIYGIDDFDKILEKEMKNGTSYIDNLTLFPIASNLAVALVNPLWKTFLINPKEITKSGIPLYSKLLNKHLSFPQNKYVNSDKIIDVDTLAKYKNSNDLYTYKIHKLSNTETIFCNHLIINEAYCYIGFKTPITMISTIKAYNELEERGEKKIKKNLNGYIDLIHTLK